MTNEFFNNVKEEYIESIRRHYLQLLAHGELSVNLLCCTSSKIQQECFDLFENEILPVADTNIIKNFLDIRSKNVLLGKDILGVKSTKFRTITYFLKEGRNTSEQTADLAAFLLDFRPRPFHSYYKSKLPGRSKTASSYFENAEITVDSPARIQDTMIDGISDQDNDWKNNSSIEQNTLDFAKLKENLLQLLGNSTEENPTNESHSLSIIRDMLLGNDNLNGSDHAEIPMMIEYPNGVRLVLKTSDVSFISKLLMLK
ncbi:hypothetical protein [Chryseobacterium indologenes]|uniref:hypothetical protein n=1 Tax=Chryseobacterium indologenes TaxID=253 RepID=UPI00124B5658|nr:hypothetical protein [Chryseobacterium indologenes]